MWKGSKVGEDSNWLSKRVKLSIEGSDGGHKQQRKLVYSWTSLGLFTITVTGKLLPLDSLTLG